MILCPVFARAGDYAVFEQRSDPQGIFANQSVLVLANTIQQTVNAAPSASGYGFAYWTLNGEPVRDILGQSPPQATFFFTNDTTAVAWYLNPSLDTDADGCADYLEWRHYGSLANGPSDDIDGDGFTHEQELARGYNPAVPDVLVDGGLMMRLSEAFTLRDEAVRKRYEIRSEPQGIVTLQTGYATTNTVVTTPSVAYGATSGYYFGYWEVNGVRQAGSTGMALSQLALTMTNDVVAVARFFTSADSDGDGMADWREWYWFGDLGMDGSSDPDGDGFTIAEELARGTEPHVSDVLVDGGLMLRLSEAFTLRDEAVKKRYEIRSEPQGIVALQTGYATINTVVTTPSVAYGATSGYYFGYWEVNGVRQAGSTGMALSLLAMTMTNDVVAVARFFTSADSDGDGMADWREWYWFGDLGMDGSSDPDGDGFMIAEELARGYEPHVRDVLVDGGLTLRLSETCTLRDEAVKKRYEIRSEPQGIVALQTGYATTNTVVTTPSVAYGATSGYYFGYWEVNGVRQAGSTGMALSQVAMTMTNNVVAVARFFTSADSDADGLADWREWYWFGDLGMDGSSDPDGDGFTITEELARGYEPHVRDVLVAGGLMMRLSEVAVVDLTGIAIARAGTNVTCYVDDTIFLDGSGSLHATQYLWRVIAAPLGSVAAVIDADSVAPRFTPDLVGTYEIELSVTGIRGSGTPDTVTIAAIDYPRATLTVASPHGDPLPSAGSHSYREGAIISARVQQWEITGETTQYVCTGWAGTGSVPPSGIATNVTVVLTSDSIVAWLWQTNYWLEVATSGSGTVVGATGFLPAGGESELVATEGPGFVFAGWTGDLAGCVVQGATVTARMDRARVLLASFRPVPVTGLAAQVAGLDTVWLTWGYAGLAAARFRVERSVGGGTWQTLGTVAGTAFEDQTVAEGMSLRYRVVAVVDGFESAGMEVAAAVPHLPAVPTGLGATAVSSHAVALFWNAAARATGYAVQRRELPLGEWAVVATLGDVVGWTDGAVAAGGRYAYRLRSVNAAGNSAFSVEVSVTVPDEQGQWPYGLRVTNVAVTVSGETFAPGGSVLCGAPVGGAFDARLSNPAGVFAQHRVVVGLRNTNGVPVGTSVEIGELTGVPPQPPSWVAGVTVPEGLRVPAEPGTYVLWAEDFLGNGDPREAFAGVVHTNETELARLLGVFDAVSPGAADAYVRLGTVAERAGRTVDLPITVGAMGGENAFSFSLDYDPSKLRFLGIRPGDAMAASFLEVNDATEGAVGVLMLLPLDVGLEAGLQELATVKFLIDGSVPSGEPIGVAFGDDPAFRMTVDAYGNPLPHVWHDGAVNVAAPGYEADVSPRGKWDDRVNDKDKALIMRFAIGLDTPAAGDEFQRADCAPVETRGDGRVDVRDAVVATRYAGGAEPLKEVGGPVDVVRPLGTVSGQLGALSQPAFGDAGDEEHLLALGLLGLIKIEASFGMRGEVVEVPVSVVSGGNIEGASFSVAFDPDELVFLEAEPAAITSNALCVVNAASAPAGVIGYAMRMPPGKGLRAGSARILTLRFRVAQAASEAVTAIGFASVPTPVILSDGSGGSVSASVQGADVYLLPVNLEGQPGTVGDLSAVIEDGTRVRLGWSDVAGETGYALYRRSTCEAWGLLAELPAGTERYVDCGLVPGMTYAYRVASVNAVGESSSDPVTVTIPTQYRYWADVHIGVLSGEPGEDRDRDGRSNYLEYLMGTDPAVPESGLLRIGFDDLYGFGEGYFTLTFDVHAWALPLLAVETTDDLRGGLWETATEVENTAHGGMRHLTYRSKRSAAAVPSQFIRLKTLE